MIGLKHISVEIPSLRLNNLDRASDLGFDENFLRSKIGTTTVSRIEPNETTIDLAFKAASNLFNETEIDKNTVDLLVLVTQTPCTGGIPHLSAVLHRQLDLRPDCHFFDISLGCSGWVQGAAVVKSYCETYGLKKALLVTADPYSKIVDRNDKNTILLFGDGATASLFDDDPVYEFQKFVLLSDTNLNEAIHRDYGGFLQMNGRRVMEFGINTVSHSIDRLLKSYGSEYPVIDRYFVHQGSKHIVDQLRKLFGFTDYQMPYCSSGYGNLVSSSLPAVLCQEWKEIGERSVACAFGVGLTSAATLLQKVK